MENRRSKLANVGGGAGGAVGWETQTSYEVSQLVVHNGVLYRAKENFTSGDTFEEDIDKWELVNANIVQWEANKYYPENCLVQYGNLIYKCITGHISSSVDFETDRSNWILFHVPTAKLEDWQASKYYYAGQCVRYNDSIFICTTNHTSDATKFDTDAGNWNILYSSIMYWVADKYYKVGSVVIYNNRIYRCKTAHRANQVPTGYDPIVNPEKIFFDYQYWTELTAIAVRDIPANRYFEANEFGLLDGVIYRANVAHKTPAYDTSGADAGETGYETEFGTIASKWDIVYASIRQYAPKTYYKVGSMVINDNKLYRCIVDHLSTDFGMNKSQIIPSPQPQGEHTELFYTFTTDIGSIEKISNITFHYRSYAYSNAFFKDTEFLVSSDDITYTSIGHVYNTHGVSYDISLNTLVDARYIKFNITVDAGTDIFHGTVIEDIRVEVIDSNSKFELIGAKESVLYSWVSDKDYNINDVVEHDKKLYRCIQAHHSTIFNNDIDNWNMVAGSLTDWQASTPYRVGDIFVYDGQIYRVQEEFTSGTTFENTRYLEPLTIEEWQANTAYTTGEIFEESGTLYKVVNDFTSGATFSVTSDIVVCPIVTFTEGTSVIIDDIVEDNGNYYIATSNFVCGDTLIETILEEYVPKHVTKSDIQDIIDAFSLSGGGSNVNSVPIGTIISFMGITAPDEYLICDGTVYNIDEYKELADFFKEEFGAYNNFGGNGTTTFAVPDLRGEFLRGNGTNGHTNQGSGANVGVHQDGTEHIYFGFHGNDNVWTAQRTLSDGSIVLQPLKRDSSISGTGDGLYISRSGINPTPGNIMQYTSRPTNTSVLYCIKYKS